MTVRELIVKVVFKDDKNSVEKTTKKIDRSFKLIQDRGSKMGRLLSAAMGRVVITAGDIAEAIKAVVRAFARVAELAGEETAALNVASVAFGKLSNETIAWARTTARQVGVADAKLITLTSRIQLSLAKITGGIEQGAIATKKLVPLGVGIARAFGRPVEDALFAITRGIQGEEEQLRKFGIETTDAALKQFALEKGLKRSISTLTQNEKALLRYAKILEETRDFQKFATKGLKTYGGALSALKGRLEALGATIGQKVQPSLVKLFNNLREVTDSANDAIVAIKKGEKQTSAWGIVLENTGDLFSNLWGGVTGLKDRIVEFVKESKTAQGVLLILGTALVGALLAMFVVFLPIPAAIASVLFALQELFGWLAGKDSLLDSIFGDFGSANRKFNELIAETKRKITNLQQWIKGKLTFASVLGIGNDPANREFNKKTKNSLQFTKRSLQFTKRSLSSLFTEPIFVGSLIPNQLLQAAEAKARGGSATFTGDIITQQYINGSSADNASAIGSASASALAQGMEEQLRKTSRDLSQ